MRPRTEAKKSLSDPALYLPDPSSCFFTSVTSPLSLTVGGRVSSPVLPAPGTGQVGEGLQNSWGLEEEEEDEDEGDVVMLEKRERRGMGETSCV